MISETLDCLVSPSWMASANCRSTDPDLFYPSEKGKWYTENVRQAVKVCSRCPVIIECLQWAYDTGDFHGILGGLTPEQRKPLREAALVHGGFDDYDRPWVLGNLMNNARERCLNVAYSERCLGYEDTALIYEEMAEEFRYLAGWTLGQKRVFYPPAA